MATFYSSKSAAAESSTSVSNAFILDYMCDAPNEYVKVYFFVLMQLQNTALASEDVLLALGISGEAFADALSYWQNVGLMRIASSDPLYVEVCPVRSKNYSPVSTAYSTKYAQLLTSLREVMGTRILSATELKTVYDWVEVYGMSEDAVVMLVAYCINLKDKRVSVRYMDEVAKTWVSQSIITAADASAYLAFINENTAVIKEIKKRWHISRNVTDDELALYKKWTDVYGLCADMILEACGELVGASNPSFGYLDRVLQTYHDRGTMDMESLTEYRKKRMRVEELARQMLVAAGIKKRPTVAQIEKVMLWNDDWRMPDDALLLVAERAQAQARPFDFITKRVTQWNSDNIRNLADAKADLDNPQQKVSSAALPQTFKQKKYSKQDLIEMGISFGGEDNE